ncbi:MAG: family 20 glycosylhydrolase, partial [Lachnospiraceae bacterium]|nr:family 20 glycosylhydrolase [Lachnospiraceae bacterium]
MKGKAKRFLALILSATVAAGIPSSHVWAAEAGNVYGEENNLPTLYEIQGEVRVGNTVITGNNVVRGKTVIASSTTNGRGPELAVDGNTSANQWNSANMKTSTATDQSKDEEAQTAQWLQIDRGADAQPTDIQAIKMWYNVKVWPMEYKILTAAESSLTANTSADTINLEEWTELVDVSRPSSSAGNGWVANGEGQNIADNAANTDTITADTTPALQEVQLQRYVLVYFSKVNAQAGGHNINLREIEIFDTTVNINVQSILNSITAESAVIENGKVVFPDQEQAGVNIRVRGSTQEKVVDNEGNVVGRNIGERDVTLIVRVEKEGNPSDFAEKNLTLTIPDYRSAYGEEFGFQQASVNSKPEVIPSLQEWHGYTGEFRLTEDSKIIYQDTASKGIEKVAQHMKEDLLEITGLELTVAEGDGPTAPQDIYIESQTEDTYGVGEEGYFLVTNEEGIRIYAPSYTGCLYGTITVEQILSQAEDNRTVPRGVTRDYPAYKVRGVMLDIARTPYRLSQLKDYTKIMLWYKMNEFHLHVNDNDNTNTAFATEETHMGFHRLESETFPSLTSEVKKVGPPAEFINEDYYLNNEDYQGNPHYTKEEWKELSALCEENGMYLLTEIDLPGHSLLYNKYAKENPDNIDWLEGGIHYTDNRLGSRGGLELLALTGDNADRAKQFAETLWEEYTQGTDPFISGDIVHIGADEYWDHDASLKDPFALLADSLRQIIQNNLGEQTKIRMWGAGTGMFSTASTALSGVDLPANYQLDLWHTSYENPRLRMQEGYEVVNCRDAFVYGNPGRDNRDVPNAEYLFNDWTPANFGGNNPLEGEPGLLGSKAVFWGDQSVEGMTEADIHQRVLRGIAIISEKTWDGTGEDDTFQEYELRASRLGEGPGTQIAMEVDSQSALVLDYDFTNLSHDKRTVYDTSGNGYDGTLSTEGNVSEDGFLTFAGSQMNTPLKTLSYPYSVAFEMRISAEEGARNTTASSIFSGYDGQLQVAGNADGDLLANVNYFTRNFNYQIPKDDTAVKIMLVGTFQGTKLYVNGAFQTFLSQASSMDGLQPNSLTSIASSFPLPLEKIGEGLHGELARLQVYNKAFSAEEVADYYQNASAELTRKVNVAQDTHAGGSSYRTGDAQDNGEQRISVAFKAIDGDAFTRKDDPTVQMDTTTSERSSYWKGDHSDSSLCIDLGETRTVSEIQLQWRYGGKGRDFNILTSLDGENFQLTKAVTGNNDFMTTVALEQPTETRFVKIQGIASNGSGYMIQEILIYESVEKTDLADTLAAAEVLLEEQGLNWETAESQIEQELLQAVILGKAIRYNMLATAREVEEADWRLEQAMENLERAEPVSYIIQLPSLEGGSVTASSQTAAAGETVTLTVVPAEGYKVESITVKGADGTAQELTTVSENSYSFQMPEQ